MEKAQTGMATHSLRALVLIASFWVLSLSLTGMGGSVGAVAGALLGLWLAERWLDSSLMVRVRVLVLWVFAILAVGSAWLISESLTGSLWLSSLLTPLFAYHSAEAIYWLVLAAVVVFLLGHMRYRTSIGVILEAVLVAAVFASSLAAHRQGMVHRPFFIGDYALVRGMDPASILLALGCLVLVALAALFIQENRSRRLPYHIAVLMLLCAGLAGYVKLFGLPTPLETDQMMITGSSSESSRGERQKNSFDDFKDLEKSEDSSPPTAIVIFRDDYEPESGVYYFRESAYSDFDGVRLQVARDNGIDEDLVEHFTAGTVDVSEEIPGQDFREPIRISVGLLTSHVTPFGLDAPHKYVNTPNPNTARFKRTYDAYSLVPELAFEDLIDRPMGAADWTEAQWQRYLQLPDDPRYLQQAQNIVERLNPEYADKPYAKALVIKNYLDINGIYDLKTKHANTADPAASFLFGDLTGYCMHFAFAATYMYRSLGIPARVGLGYMVPSELRAGGSALLIRSMNGHAWPEIYVRGVGWVIVDPTPQQTNVDMTQQPQTELQQLLADLLRDQESFEDYLQSQQPSSLPWRVIFMSMLSALLLALCFCYGVKEYRLWIPARAPAQQRYRLFYRAALDRLSAFGVVRRFGETREAFARRVAAISPSFGQLSDRHLQAALGTESAMDWHWQNADRDFQRELVAANPRWRQLWAWLNPISWLRTK